MSKKLFRVVCTREETIYVAADSERAAEKWAASNVKEWEEDLISDTWDAHASPAQLPLRDGWNEKCLAYGSHVSRRFNDKNQEALDITCEDVMDGKLE